MREPDRRRRIGRAFGVTMTLVALAATLIWVWMPLAGAQTVVEPPPPPPPPPTVVPPPPPPSDPATQPSPTPPPPTDDGWSATSVPAWDPDRAEGDDPLRRWRDWTPTPGSYDTSSLDRFAERMRERGWGEGRIRREVYAPFIVVGPATWSDSWGALRLVAGPRPHRGQDVLCTYGAPVLATEEGTVTWSTSSLGGLAAYLHLADGGFYYYAHLSGTPQGMPPGSVVAAGDVIGFCGATGNASVPHVHFSYVTAGGISIDPMDHLRGWLETAERRLPNPPPPRPEDPDDTVAPVDAVGGAAPTGVSPPPPAYPTWGGATAAPPAESDPPESIATGAAAALGSSATVPTVALLLGVPLLGLLRRRIREPWS